MKDFLERTLNVQNGLRVDGIADAFSFGNKMRDPHFIIIVGALTGFLSGIVSRMIVRTSSPYASS